MVRGEGGLVFEGILCCWVRVGEMNVEDNVDF